MNGCALINSFLDRLESGNVNYVHWKSNVNINKALIGNDDLDLLVELSYEKELTLILKDLDIVEVSSYKDNWQSGIKNYIGFDCKLNKLIHFHLHFKLPVGYDFDKNYVLPIESNYLKSRSKYKNIYLPSVENEYILLVIRLILKNGLLPFSQQLFTNKIKIWKLSKKAGIVTGGGYREFQDLESKIDREKVKKSLKSGFSFINQSLFTDCEQVIKENNSLMSYFKASSALEAALKSMRKNSIIKSYFLSLIRINQSRYKNLLKKVFKYNSFGKVPVNGGRIFAFAGGDGAGKSTTIDLLKGTLSRHFKVQVIHVGRPSKSFLGTTLKISKKIFNIFIPKDMSLALSYLALAFDRLSEFERACKLREKGYIVLLDRIPLKGITTMDCPRVRMNIGNKFVFLSRLEETIYQKINGVDDLFVLKLDPDIALLRRPEDEPNELRLRSGQIWNEDWVAPYAKVINTGITNVEEVQGRILNFINQSLRQSYDFIEIIGLNGTGKSSLINQIKSKHNNVTSSIPVKKYKILLCLSCLVSIPWAVKAYVKTQDINVVMNVLHLFSSIMVIKYWKFTNHKPASNFILDQGPYFQIALLRKENILKCDLFEKTANSYINNVVYLSADNDVLWKRVKNRKDHTCRGQHMSKPEFIDFCSRYSDEFNSLSCRHFKIVDTSNISPIELLNVLIREKVVSE